MFHNLNSNNTKENTKKPIIFVSIKKKKTQDNFKELKMKIA